MRLPLQEALQQTTKRLQPRDPAFRHAVLGLDLRTHRRKPGAAVEWLPRLPPRLGDAAADALHLEFLLREAFAVRQEPILCSLDRAAALREPEALVLLLVLPVADKLA